MTAAENAILEGGAIKTRADTTNLGAAVLNGYKINGVFPFYKTGAEALFAVAGTSLKKYNSTSQSWDAITGTVTNAPTTAAMLNDVLTLWHGGTPQKVTESGGTYTLSSMRTQTSLTANASAGATSISVASATGFVVNDWVGIGSGANFEWVQVISIVGTTFTLRTPLEFSHSTGDAVYKGAPQGKYAVAAYEQLFVGGIAGRDGDLDFCDVADPETWAPSPTNEAGSITVTDKNDPITWVDFDPIEGKVVIWTRYGLYVLNGPETPNRPNLWSVRAASNYGTPDGRTVRRVSGAWLWLTNQEDKRGVAVWSGGAIQVAYDPIADLVDDIDWSGAMASALDERGHYILRVTSRTDGTSFCIVFDPTTGAWTSWKDLDLTAYGAFRIDNRDTPLLGMASGQIERFADETMVNNVNWAVRIGPASLGDPAGEDKVKRVYLVLSKAAGASMAVRLSMDEGRTWSDWKVVDTEARLVRQKLTLGLTGATVRGVTALLEMEGQGPVEIHDIRFVISERRI
jgi:hypothetical protein